MDMRKMYKQPTVEVLSRVIGVASLMSGSLNSSLKHPEDSGLPSRAPAKKDVF